MKLFAELEIKRKEREAKEMHERWVGALQGLGRGGCGLRSVVMATVIFLWLFPPHAGKGKGKKRSRLRRKPSVRGNGRRTLR